MARPSPQNRTSLSLAFFYQAETDFRDAMALWDHRGLACTVLTLLQSASEKAVKAFLAPRYATRAFFDRLRGLSHARGLANPARTGVDAAQPGVPNDGQSPVPLARGPDD